MTPVQCMSDRLQELEARRDCGCVPPSRSSVGVCCAPTHLHPMGLTSLCPRGRWNSSMLWHNSRALCCKVCPEQLLEEAEHLAQEEYCCIIPRASWEETVSHYKPKRAGSWVCFFFFLSFFFQFNIIKM